MGVVDAYQRYKWQEEGSKMWLKMHNTKNKTEQVKEWN